ncbi:MAG TPA: CoA-acylating methylmalonate-semialdehyde dehydrogenase [Thermoanaerobaculia bacterium]|jgi:malonate-semialdehyde dehydrogenase (acetylating)/methylmalonate-semialdehyde dehydrogenase|nr:CoA-acylating methylmalonate-semialdehyde dehydrogenase [Thermoanaerobaculia bacterium]
MSGTAVANDRQSDSRSSGSPEVLRNYVGGRWIESRARDFFDVYNPATGEVIAKAPLSTAEDLDRAVAAAKKAFPAWRDTPAVVRARSLFRFRQLLEDHFEELASIVTTEHGKTLDESRGSVRRGIECVEVACGSPSLMMGYGLENISSNIDCQMIRQAVGVCAAIAPFNFPAMVPLWFLPFAIGTGNTFILKPSEQVPLSQRRMIQLLEKCDLPPGVVNLVQGGRAVVEAICDHPEIRAVSFVGSTPVARAVYQRATHAGKRVQALGGAKNYIVVMPDADLERAMPIITESFYGCAGERCLAGSVLVPVGEAHSQTRDRMVESARALKVGDGKEPGVSMGPVISGRHKERVVGYIEKGVAEGARLLVDGRQARVPDRGFFLGPTLFDGVSSSMTIGHEEIFGPVASISPVKTLEEAIQVMHAHPNANATSIFTQSGKSAREFARLATASMVGVNIGVAAPMAYFPFGGAKDSFFGDLKVHGRDAFEFYTDKKVVISRWF